MTSMTSYYQHTSDETYNTILGPRDSSSASVFAVLMNTEDNERTVRRQKYYWKTLCFTMCIASMFKFPDELLRVQNKALYIFFFLIYSFVFGIPIILFEMTVGHFYTRGFARIFSFSPIFEAITIALVFYSFFVGITFSSLNIHSMHYIFLSFHQMPHSDCTNYTNCTENWTDYRQSPEYYHFHNIVVKDYVWIDLLQCLFVWTLIALAIYYGITKHFQLQMTICTLIVTALLYTTIAALVCQKTIFNWMDFVKPSNSYSKFSVYIEPMEQVLFTYGLAIGPMITYWSFSIFTVWSHNYYLIIFTSTLIATVCTTIITFSSIRHNIEDYFSNDLHISIVRAQMINQFPPGMNNFTCFLFNLMMYVASFFVIMECTKVFVCYLKTYWMKEVLTRVIVLVVSCTAFALISFCLTNFVSIGLSNSIHQMFIGPGALFIIFCEMTAVMYIYGVHDFCDDIEFLLGYYPNTFHQIIWRILPFILLPTFICSVAVKFKEASSTTDLVMLVLMFVLIVVPIVGLFALRLIVGFNQNNIRQQINVRSTD